MATEMFYNIMDNQIKDSRLTLQQCIEVLDRFTLYIPPKADALIIFLDTCSGAGDHSMTKLIRALVGSLHSMSTRGSLSLSKRSRETLSELVWDHGITKPCITRDEEELIFMIDDL